MTSSLLTPTAKWLQARKTWETSPATSDDQSGQDSGLSRECLYQEVPGDHYPSLYTILKVVSAMDLNLSASVRSEAVIA